MRGETKITAAHRDRLAIVYVRQSTLAQVRDHTESTARQYALTEEAARLGWPGSAIEVIDADLGISGRQAANRPGFKDLMGRVCVGEVGAIFGLEVSRLARSSADLGRLLEMARLTDTLMIDGDGIYDLADINDRLLLGLKGAMSEAELHLLAGRLQGAKRAAAARGELRSPLPVGYAYDDEGATVVEADEEVRAAIADVFAAFAATGSAYQVVGAFRGRRFPRRQWDGAWGGDLRFGALTHSRVLGILSNPTYAGAYVYGRHRTRQTVAIDGTVRTRTTQLPQDQWAVLIFDHHPGYITWEQFQANGARLAANRTNAGARPPREGDALCQGIVHCGSCGRAMSTRYAGGHAYYECSRSGADHVATTTCRCVRADTIDTAVTAAMLSALTGDEVALALAAADEVTDRRQRSTKAAELAVERARYQTQRAERAFNAVEPENRLVARSLEARWEARLADLVHAEAAVAAQRHATTPLPSRDQLAAAVADLPALWAAATTADRDRKRLLRTVIADVTLLPEPDERQCRVGLRWRSGAADELVVQRRVRVHEARATKAATIALARQLGPGLDNAALADALNDAGHRTGTGRPFNRVAIASLRHYHAIASPELLHDGELTVRDVAHRLGVSDGAINNWILTGALPARRGNGGRWCIPFDSSTETAWRARVAASPHIHADADGQARQPGELSIPEIASRLGVATDVVYHWNQQGQLPSRRGKGGRVWTRFNDEVEAACRRRIAASCHLPPAVKAQASNPPTGGTV